MIPPPLEEIETLIRRVAEGEGLELVDLEFKSGKSRSLLRIYIDKQGGVTLGDCENISQQVSTLLDVQDLLKNAYVLEVSSPGLGRAFKNDRDFDRALGRTVKAVIAQEEGKTSEIIGTLVNVTPREIEIDDRGNVRRFARETLTRMQEDFGQPAQPKKNQRKKRNNK